MKQPTEDDADYQQYLKQLEEERGSPIPSLAEVESYEYNEVTVKPKKKPTKNAGIESYEYNLPSNIGGRILTLETEPKSEEKEDSNKDEAFDYDIDIDDDHNKIITKNPSLKSNDWNTRTPGSEEKEDSNKDEAFDYDIDIDDDHNKIITKNPSLKSNDWNTRTPARLEVFLRHLSKKRPSFMWS